MEKTVDDHQCISIFGNLFFGIKSVINKIWSRTLFRRNALVKGEALVRERMKEAETRLTMATHYGNPYPR